jgi:TRAP-type mannitol/chloroaromatic compound transport system substrate-binding protein
MVHNFISLNKWNELSTTYKSIIRSASALANEWMLAKYDANNPAALKYLVADGAQLRPFNQAVLEASYKAANQVFAKTSAGNADFKKAYDSMVAFRGDEYLWWQVAEYTFDTFQIRMRTRG